MYKLQQSDTTSVEKLLTTVNSHHERVSMHGLRVELMQRQLKQLQIPSQILKLPAQPSMERYNQLMSETVSDLQDEGFTHAAFGDIFWKIYVPTVKNNCKV